FELNVAAHWQLKFLASSVFPSPPYWACLGYAHNGRLRPGNARPVAITASGAIPFSTQFTTAPSMSNWSSPGPPPQWLIPGTRNIRLHSLTLPAPPFVAAKDL